MNLAVIGECMLELAPLGPDQYRLSYGGDVLNTGVYAARGGIKTTFFSALGDGFNSDWLVKAWRAEGIDCREVQRLPGLEPGLYMIQNDDDGERNFHYWRSASPFRLWLKDREYCKELPEKLACFEQIHYSGITLAMLEAPDRDRLLTLLADYRQKGGRVSFDPNYRPRLWASLSEANLWLDRGYDNADIALPSLEDEIQRRRDSSIEETIQLLDKHKLNELVVKAGNQGCWIRDSDASRQIPVSRDIKAIDTTGAGDAFNAGYLVARSKGQDPTTSAIAGQKLASRILQHHGAIIPRDD